MSGVIFGTVAFSNSFIIQEDVSFFIGRTFLRTNNKASINGKLGIA